MNSPILFVSPTDPSELRFTIDEADSDECRARFLAEHADEAQAIWEKEMTRRERRKAHHRDTEARSPEEDGEVGEEGETEGEDA